MRYSITVLLALLFCAMFFSEAQADIRVRIKKGETLWSLAQKHYGQGRQYGKIAKANKIRDPRTLRVGSWITIPGAGKPKDVLASPAASADLGKTSSPAQKNSFALQGGEEGTVHAAIAPLRQDNACRENVEIVIVNAVLLAENSSDKVLQAEAAETEAQKRETETESAEKEAVPEKTPEAGAAKESGNFRDLSSPNNSRELNWELDLKGFYGCTDILSECRGGESEAILYFEKPDHKGHSFGLGVQAFGAYGKIVEERYIWHKISAGGGPEYKHAWNNSQLTLGSSLLVQSLKSDIYGFKKKQKDLLWMQTVEYLHRPGNWLWGISLSGKLPLATSFSSEMPSFLGDHRSNQAAAEAKLLLQHDLTDSFRLRWSFSPYNYQGQENTTGIKASLELRIKERLILEGGVLAYPYGVPNKLSDYGVRSSDLTGGFFGLKVEFGADRLRSMR